MMDATFSARNRLKDRKTALGLSLGYLAVLAGTSKNRLNQYLIGQLRFDTPEEGQLLELTERLLNYADAIKPLQFPADPLECLNLLRYLKLQDIGPERVRAIIGLMTGKDSNV